MRYFIARSDLISPFEKNINGDKLKTALGLYVVTQKTTTVYAK